MEISKSKLNRVGFRTEAGKPAGYWITGVPDSITECGPYDTLKEAQEDLRGLKRFFSKEERKRPTNV